MKIELEDNKVFFENEGLKKEIHPFWLRERVNGKDFVDKGSQQRLFDPTKLHENIKINALNLSKDFPVMYGTVSIVLAIVLGIAAAFIRKFFSDLRKKIQQPVA